MAGGIKMNLFGKKQQETLREELERFQRRVKHVRRVLTDSNHANFTLITIPEKMAVSETMRAYESLQEFGLCVNGVVVNRITPDLEHPFLQSRRIVEQEYISQLKKIFETVSLAELELESSAIHGIELLVDLGNKLHGETVILPDDLSKKIIGKGIPVGIRRCLVIEENEKLLEVSVILPGAKKDELNLRGEGEYLIISVNGRDVPIRTGYDIDVKCAIARFEDDILKISIPSEGFKRIE